MSLIKRNGVKLLAAGALGLAFQGGQTFTAADRQFEGVTRIDYDRIYGNNPDQEVSPLEARNLASQILFNDANIAQGNRLLISAIVSELQAIGLAAAAGAVALNRRNRSLSQPSVEQPQIASK